MKIVYDADSGDVVVVIREPAIGASAHSTHQFRKFGITMYWDGHAGLLGIGFRQDVSTLPNFYRLPDGDRMPLRDQQLVSRH
jgi:hypothetical protein